MVFQCQIENCEKLFSCKKTLKEHQRTHTGERPYICSSCQQTFAQYSSLQKHQRVHDKRKPYTCKFDGCNQAFSQISNLIRHERIHTGEKPYICMYCKKKFASGSNLKQHIQVHDNDETRIQYKCYVDSCGKGYLYISSLKKHIQVSHPINYETEIKTNQVDLNNCKEIIQDLANHQYHDDEEDKEQEENNQLLGKRKNHNDKVVQQVPQRRKLKIQNSNTQVHKVSEVNSMSQKSQIQAIIDKHVHAKNDQSKNTDQAHVTNQIDYKQKSSYPKQQEITNQSIKQIQQENEQQSIECKIQEKSKYYKDQEERNSVEGRTQLLQVKQEQTHQGQQHSNHQRDPLLKQTLQVQQQNQINPQANQIELNNSMNNLHGPKKVQAVIRAPIPQTQPSQLLILQQQQIQSQQFLRNRLTPDILKTQMSGIQHFNNSQKSLEGNFKLQQTQVQQQQLPSQQQQQQTTPIKQSFQPFNQYVNSINTQNQVNQQQQVQQQQQQQQQQILSQPQPLQQPDIQNELVQEMASLQMKLQQIAPDYFSQVQKLVNDYAMIASALTMHLSQQQSQPQATNDKDVQSQQQQQQISQQDKIPQQDITNQTNVQTQQDKVLIQNLQVTQNEVDQSEQSVMNDAENENYTIENIAINRIDLQRDPKVVGIISEEKNLLSINVQDSSKENSVDSSGQQNKRFKYQSVPLNLNKKSKQEQQQQQPQQTSEIFPKSNLQSENPVDETINTFRTSRSNSFSNPDQDKNISDFYQSMSKNGDNNLSQETKFDSGKKHQRHKSKTAYYDDSLFQSQQAAKISERQQSGCGSRGDGGGCCGGGCGSQTPQNQSNESPIRQALQVQVKQNNEGCCQGKSKDQGVRSERGDQQCGIDDDEEAAMIQEMNSTGIDGQEFKQPYPVLNKVQSSLLNKNKDQTLMLFSKLPCIKTCMTKVSFSSDDKQAVSQCKGNKSIGFESVEDDFVSQSSSQLGTAACKHICDAQKLCPEILPVNCDDYFNKKCNCTVYCKKTLKFIQKFVKDDAQVAEIEDLCNIQDQISLMVSQGSKC